MLVKGSQSPNGRAGSSRDKGTAATSHFFRDPQPNSSAIKIPFKKRSKVGAGGGSIYTKKMVAVLTHRPKFMGVMPERDPSCLRESKRTLILDVIPIYLSF